MAEISHSLASRSAKARAGIFGDIRAALKPMRTEGAAATVVDDRIARHPRNLVPARANLPQPEQVALFIAKATEVMTSVERVASASDVPKAIADYLKGKNLAPELRLAPDPRLSAIPWDRQPTLALTSGHARDRDATSVTGAVAGIAETGTLMMMSGPGAPITLNFMPDNHIVIMDPSRIVGSYEDGWDVARTRDGGAMPRAVNFITGPSRTADIEQQLQLGAHGPRNLHIILVDQLDRGDQGPSESDGSSA
ncbi:MAG: lactate utilization protein C [Azospirillum sp.]|nr:lactate utilization protein C [Azospirillum sp.]